MTKITYIPGEIANAAIDEHGNRKPVTRTQHIFDDDLEKPQNEVNQDRIEDVATLDGKIALEKQRAEGVESGLNNRLGTVEQLAEISIGGGDAQIATGADFTNPDATKRAKVTTVGAIIDGLNDGVYDVSKRNPSGGPNSDGKFTLDYILDNANTLIPTSWRHGGMSISFVDSSDNKYVQFRLMNQTFSTNEVDWQGVDDKPKLMSRNLVESNGVRRAISQVAYNIGGMDFIGANTFPRWTEIFTAADVREGDVLAFDITQGQIVIYVGDSIAKYISTDQNYTIPTGFTKAVAYSVEDVIIVSIKNISVKDTRDIAEIIIGNNKTKFNIGQKSFEGWSGNAGDVVFTKDDVNIKTGDYIECYVTSGQLAFCKTDNTIIKYCGVGGTGVPDIPSDFGYVKANQANTVVTSIINNTILDNRKLDEKIDSIPAILTHGMVIGFDTTSLTDMNNAKINTLYIVRLISEPRPTNYHPQTKIYQSYDYEYVLTTFFKNGNVNQSGYGLQFCYDSLSGMPVWERNFIKDASGNTTWGNWTPCQKRTTIEVGSDKYFTTIKSACDFAFAYSTPHTLPLFLESPKCFDIIINEGEYDILSEITGEPSTYEGIKIGRGMRLYFNKGSKVVCEYNGDDETFATYFSIFRNSYGSAEIYGLNAYAKNIRYIIHDEKGGGDGTPSVNIYKNCNLKIIKDSSYPGDIPNRTCIGVGLGNKTTVLVEDCVFDGGSECLDTEAVFASHTPVRSNNSTCSVTVKDCYFKTGTISVWSVESNTTTEKIPYLITNNSVKSAPYYTINTVDNIDFMVWNNEIRS